MIGQIAAVHFQSYQLALDMAKRAERALRSSNSAMTTSFHVEGGYWDSLKKGLLAGERLQLDLRRMDAAYVEQNRREYELTKHVSLRQLDPLALLALKATGACDVALPEWLFDLDCPGHYLRRIRSGRPLDPLRRRALCQRQLHRVAASQHGALLAAGGSGYARDGADALRFVDQFGAIQSVVTSRGPKDSGLFETGCADERLLPFEGCGVIGEWRLELPRELRQFDYETISDVVIH